MASPDDDLIRKEFGPYRVLRELGRGATGLVFLAERRDDEFHRPVALKVLRYAVWDRRSQDLLTSERRMLSQLQHPNIAALLDWGTTEDGTQWMATEYVEGEPIDAWCRERALDVPGMLGVFEQVCRAVEYAHRRLVVHRDLKPANTLVTSAGLVKLLDFGISKPLDDISSTVTTERRFTPAYASPEQVLGEPVTAASDVYSLGLILYELLSGVLPDAAGSVGDLLRRVMDTPTPPPSAAPNLTPERRRMLRGDLDRLVLHALERDPSRRYPSVEQLLADLERYRTGFPIAAARPTAMYRTKKFVRRNALPVALSAAVVVTIVGGAALALRNAREARRQQRVAEQRFADLRDLAHWVIFDAHDMIRLVPGTVEVRRALLSKAVEYLDSLNAQTVKDDALLKEIGQAYIRVAYFQGGVTGTNIGTTEKSRQTYRAALAIFDDLWPRHPDDEAIGSGRFAAVYSLSMMLNDPAEGAALANRYLPDLDAWVRRNAHPAPLQATARVRAALGRTLRALGRLDEALAEFDLSVRASRQATPMTQQDEDLPPMFRTSSNRGQNFFDTAQAMFARTETLLEMGRTAEAAASAEEARSFFEQSSKIGQGGPSDERMFARGNGLKAQALWELHDPARLDDAWVASRIEMVAALANMKDGMATAKRDLAEAHRHAGNILVARKSVEAGLEELRQAVTTMGEVARDDPAFLMNRYLLASMLNDYGVALAQARRAEAAAAAFKEAFDTANRGTSESPNWVELLRECARARSGLARLGQKEQATLAAGDWAELSRRSPLNRRYQDER